MEKSRLNSLNFPKIIQKAKIKPIFQRNINAEIKI